MTRWNTIEELIEEFKLKSPDYDLDLLEKELSEKRNKLHPDKTGGDFELKKQKKEYHRLSEAIDFIKEHKSKALIPVSHLPAVIEALSKAITQPFEIQQAESTLKTSYNEHLISRYRLPKASFATISVIFSVIFFFWDILERYGYIRYMYSDFPIRLISLSISLFSVFLFSIISLRKISTHSYLEFLLSEEGLHCLFELLVTDSGTLEFERRFDNGICFSKRNIIQLLRHNFWDHCRWRGLYRRSLFELSPGKLPPGVASECADIILEKLKRRGVIEKRNVIDIDEWYEITYKADFI